MLNITARLALSIENLPDWDINWKDYTPQCSRDSLTISDFVSSVDDAVINKSATLYIMEFLVQEFPFLCDLKRHVPSRQPLHVTKKPTPMKVLFKDESIKQKQLKLLGNSLKMAS